MAERQIEGILGRGSSNERQKAVRKYDPELRAFRRKSVDDC